MIYFDIFLSVPVDRTSNNFGIVYKKFYLDVFENELGNKVYNVSNISGCLGYIHIYEQKLLSTFGMELLDINQYIPLHY